MELVEIGFWYNPKSAVFCKIENKSLCCPFCQTTIVPQYIFSIREDFGSGYADVFSRCTNSSCQKVFIVRFNKTNQGYGHFEKILPTASPTSKDFSNTIAELSPNFVIIYNQAYAAEQMGLDQICGTGYRKALEFLIKDYLISTQPEDKHDAIKNKFLNNCIREDIENANIKNVSARAVWLGNDETHYTRKWENKDVNDLKALISLTLHWIESEIQTKKLLEDMTEFR